MAENTTTRELTALEYANERENVVVRIAGSGCPAGRDIAWIPPETYLPFDLSEVEGEIAADGSFTATNLGRFHDHKSNLICALSLRVDPEVWAEQHAELMGE